MGKYATVEEYLDSLPPELRPIADELCRLVRAAMPAATEAIKWSMPTWSHQGPFCYVKAFRRHVNLGFWRGMALDDPHGVIDTTGEKMGHVSFEPVLRSTRPRLRRSFVRLPRSTRPSVIPHVPADVCHQLATVARFGAPDLVSMRCTWSFTVASEIDSARPIARFVHPWATKAATSRSRGVRLSKCLLGFCRSCSITITGTRTAPSAGSTVTTTPAGTASVSAAML
jgi:hypothetical protein